MTRKGVSVITQEVRGVSVILHIVRGVSVNCRSIKLLGNVLEINMLYLVLHLALLPRSVRSISQHQGTCRGQGASSASHRFSGYLIRETITRNILRPLLELLNVGFDPYSATRKMQIWCEITFPSNQATHEVGFAVYPATLMASETGEVHHRERDQRYCLVRKASLEDATLPLCDRYYWLQRPGQ